MATIKVGDYTPKNQHISDGETSFTYSFPILSDSDLKVFIGSTQKTLSAEYTVTDVGGETGGEVVFNTATTVGDIVTIYRDIPVARTTDYATGGALLAENLNNDLDRLVMMTQQNEAAYSNTIRVDQFDIHTDLTLPPKDERLGKTLAFNEFGNPVAGPSIGDVNNVSVSSEYITLLAEIQNGVVATDVLTTLAEEIENVKTVGSIGEEGLQGIVDNKDNIDTVGTNLTTTDTIGAVAGDILDVNTVAGQETEIGLVAGQIAPNNNILTVADNVGDIQACVTNISDIQNAVQSATNASGSASAAALSAGAASTSEGLASDWANKPIGELVDGVNYSAKHYADAAESAASGGISLNGLADVDTNQNLVGGSLLQYDGVNQEWKPSDDTAGTLATTGKAIAMAMVFG